MKESEIALSCRKKDVLYWSMVVLFAFVMGMALFAKLDTKPVAFTDEGTHGVNAYEMIQNKNYLINTLRYEVDYYNSKPPLMLWLIILGLKLFGCNPFGLRVFSAFAGFVIFLLTFTWLYRERGRMQALLFSAFLPACTFLFDFHMFRAGDMDAVYTLFFLLAMIALYYATKNIKYLLLYGVFLGLAFLTKSTHVMTIIAIGLVYIPFLNKNDKLIKTIKWYLLSYVCAGIVVLPWAIARFCFDKFDFFYKMLFGETIGRVQNNALASVKEYFFYLNQLIREPICCICILAILVAFCFKCVQIIREKKRFRVGNLCSEKSFPFLSLMVIWFGAVFGLYSVAKGGLEWYIFSAYIPLLILGAEAVKYLYMQIRKLQIGLEYGLVAGCLIISIFVSARMIYNYPWHGTGGNSTTILYDCLLDLKDREDELGRSFSKQIMYIENGRNDAFERNRWQHNDMFCAMCALDVICQDGGAVLFLESEDPNALLVLDKSLWDEYAPVLTGYVILEDNDYLVFCKQKYGE